jgi:hypothetical protein
MNFNPEYPIVIAFAGNAGAGKTSTANAIVPGASMQRYGDQPFPSEVWDHLFFAMPIYEMVNVKTQIQGDNKDDRILFSLHDIVYDLVQRRCTYDDCIELVYDLFAMDCDISHGDKPRTFMQQAGDHCRVLYEDCFAEKAIRTINNRFQEVSIEYERYDEDPPASFNIISDLRMRNELDVVRRQPNNLVIKFIADQKILDQRIMERAGQVLNSEQKSHKSESELLTISDDEFDVIVDTSTLTLQDQAAMVKEVIYSSIRNFV